MTNRTLALFTVAALVCSPAALRAQDARLDARLDAHTRDAVITLIDSARAAGMPLVKSVELFDLYQGPPIPDGKINLAYHITYQSPERTLTDVEVAAVHRAIEQALVGQLNAELRG